MRGGDLKWSRFGFLQQRLSCAFPEAHSDRCLRPQTMKASVCVLMLAVCRRYVASSFSSTPLQAMDRSIHRHHRSTRASQDDLLDQLLNDPSLLLGNERQSCLEHEMEDEKSQTRGNGWKTIDWFKESKETIHCPSEASPVDTILIGDRRVYVKRDDLLQLPGSHVSGNKARKFLALNNLRETEFPRCIVSYGGPQSNAMVALAAIVHFRNQNERAAGDDTPNNTNPYRFVYYSKKLPRFLRSNPSGNLFRAKALGMELIELPSHDKYNDLFGSEWGGKTEPPLALQPPIPGHSLWVPQGGASGVALAGARRLAKELVEFWKNQGRKIGPSNASPLSVCLPGGTCSTALLLHHAIKSEIDYHDEKNMDIKVVVIPCVGDEVYSQRQMMGLNANLGYAKDDIPAILSLNVPDDGQQQSKNDQYFSFGQPHPELLETYRYMKDEHDLVVDLLYGAPSWTIMLRHFNAKPTCGDGKALSAFDDALPLKGRSVLYVHSGGLEGVGTQLLRYRYKGLVSHEEAQTPQRQIPNELQNHGNKYPIIVEADCQ